MLPDGREIISARIIAEPIGASRFPAHAVYGREVDEPARRDADREALVEFGGQLDGMIESTPS